MYLRLIILLSLLSVCAGADVPPDQAPEVDHLIEYLATSDCEMIRNGKAYSGEKGAQHVRRKYDHFRDQISTTEDFIEFSATRSALSGKDYQVTCFDQEPVRAQDWLLQELKVYRGL